MTPSPPVWISRSRIPCPSGESTLPTSTGESPVTQTADVEIRDGRPVLRCRCSVYGRPVELVSGLFGMHHAYTMGYVLGVSHFLGVSPDQVAYGLEAMQAPQGRGAVELLEGGVLVDESYNANPASVGAALRNLRALALSGRRVAVLGGMRELGEMSSQLHRKILREASFLDALIVVGEEWGSCDGDLPAQGHRVPDAVALSGDGRSQR